MNTNAGPQVSVIIVNWNGAAVLPRCLAALDAQTWRDFEVLLVDNGSTDGSVAMVRAGWPAVRIEALGENAGFARANNIGAQRARGRWLALLNSDAFPEPAWLENLMRATGAYPNAGVFASRLLQANRPAWLDGAGDVYHASGAVWRRSFNLPAVDYGQAGGEVFSACAAAALYDRAQFMALGGFDEDFFSYLEDMDLAFRWRLAGGRCVYVPAAVVHHVGSASQGSHSAFNLYHGQRNMVWTYVKNMPGWTFWAWLPAHVVVNAVQALVYTLRGRGGAVWRGKWDALRGLPKMLQKRRAIQAARTVKPGALLRQMDRHPLTPFFRRLRH